MSRISDLVQDPKNANRGTKRGNELVEASLREYGAGRSILIDRNGKIIAGNKTVANAQAAGLEDLMVIQSDGSRLIAVQRTDLDLDDAKAKALAIADNRTAEIGLEWDPAILGELANEMDLNPFFSDEELTEMGATLPAFQPGDAADQHRLDEKNKVTCPACQHVFTPS
jgi:ParB-like chromosome segregation protein Spo0J